MKTTKKYGKQADTALSLWVKLARASATFGKLSSENIRTFGLTEPQFAVIECLGHLGPLRHSELSKKMLVSGGNITCVIDNLEKENLVERIQSKKDRRVIMVRLTSKGQRFFKDKFVQHAKFITTITSVLSAVEQDQLATLLKKFGLALQEQFPENRNGND